jgi:head-tail adaptor
VIGLLRCRIEILAPARLADGAGGAGLSWSVVETMWAGLRRLSAARDLAGEADRRLGRIAATVRFRPWIREGLRVRFEAADYEIVSVESDGGRERALILVCEERR